MNKLYLNGPIKEFPIKAKIVKRKLIIHDQEKILLFKEKSRINKVFVPNLYNEENELLWKNFTNRFTSISEEKPFLETVDYEVCFDEVNLKLKKKYYEYIRAFYACRVNFDKELEREISDFAAQVNLEPKLFTFEEVKNIVASKKVKIDSSLSIAADVLEQKIKEYVKK